MDRFVTLAIIVLALAIAVVGCGGATPAAQTAAPIVQTVIVAGTPQQVIVTATPAPTSAPSAKDTIIIGSFQEPRTFNYLSAQGNQAIRAEMFEVWRPNIISENGYGFQANPNIMDGDLPSIDKGTAAQITVTVPKGTLYFDTQKAFSIVTATEDVKTTQMVITGTIKSGLKWDDGQPFTAKDFVFTWQTNCSPDFQAAGALDNSLCPPQSSGVGNLIKMEAPDDTHVVATLTPGVVDPTYFLDWGAYSTNCLGCGPLPQHVFANEKPADIFKDTKLGQSLIGYGPYMLKEWVKGDHASFVPNPNWGGDKPKTPNVIYKFIADTNQLMAQLLIGDIDAGGGTTGLGLDQYLALKDADTKGTIHLFVDKKAPTWEHLDFNLNDPKDKTLKAPNPFFSDPRVRQAIAYAINRDKMVKEIVYDQAEKVYEPFLSEQWAYTDSVTKYEYNVDKANQLLDQAGWTKGADGIRAKNGVKLSFTIYTTSGSNLRAKNTQYEQADLKAVGVDAKVVTQPSNVLFGETLTQREFDLIEFAWVGASDPDSWGQYACSQIPTPDNGFVGSNDMGWCDQQASDAITRANFADLTQADRKKDYAVFNQRFTDPSQLSSIPIYSRPNVYGWGPGVKGIQPDPTEYFTYNIQDWTAQ